MLAALGVPVLLDRIDHSIRDSQTAGAALAAPVLSTIPAPGSSQVSALARRDLREASPTALAAASVATDQLPRHRGDGPDRADAGHGGGELRRRWRTSAWVLVPTHPRQSWYADAPDGSPTLPDFLNLAYTGRLNGEVPGQLQRTPSGTCASCPTARPRPTS